MLLVLALSNVYISLPVGLFLICSTVFRTFYLKISKQIITLEGVSRSFVVQHAISSLNGLSIINAFNKERAFIKKYIR
jgi:hypothetical protein